MQPRPIADTVRPLVPSCRVFIGLTTITLYMSAPRWVKGQAIGRTAPESMTSPESASRGESTCEGGRWSDWFRGVPGNRRHGAGAVRAPAQRAVERRLGAERDDPEPRAPRPGLERQNRRRHDQSGRGRRHHAEEDNRRACGAHLRRMDGTACEGAGKRVPIVIEGKVVNLGSYDRTMSGTWTPGRRQKGDFKLTRN